MTIDPVIAIAVAALFLLVVIALALLAQGRASARLREDLIRLHTQLEEQGRQFENRGHFLEEAIRRTHSDIHSDVTRAQHAAERQLQEHQAKLGLTLSEHETHFERRHGESLKSIQETLDTGYRTLHQQVLQSLQRSTQELTRRFEGLTDTTDKKLQEISGQVEKRLNEGFEKNDRDLCRRIETSRAHRRGSKEDHRAVKQCGQSARSIVR